MRYIVKKIYISDCRSYNDQVKKAIELLVKSESLLEIYYTYHNKGVDGRWADLVALRTNVSDYTNCLRVEIQFFLLKLESNEWGYKEIFKIALKVSAVSSRLSEYTSALEKLMQQDGPGGGKQTTFFDAPNVFFPRRS